MQRLARTSNLLLFSIGGKSGHDWWFIQICDHDGYILCASASGLDFSEPYVVWLLDADAVAGDSRRSLGRINKAVKKGVLSDSRRPVGARNRIHDRLRWRHWHLTADCVEQILHNYSYGYLWHLAAHTATDLNRAIVSGS